MKRAISAAILGAFCGSALANGGGQQLNAAAASSKANASASARSQAVGLGVGQGFGGTANALGVGGTASAAGGSVSYNVPAQQTITSNGRVQVENVPNIYAPNIYPTAPCMGSSSAGAGWGGFGLSGGTSWVDTECQLQEAARNAPTSADRVYVWCKTAAAKGAPSCAGLAPDSAAVTGSVPTERDRRTVSVVDQNVWRGGE